MSSRKNVLRNHPKSNKRALDTLDKLLSQRSNQYNNGSSSPAGLASWMKSRSPPQVTKLPQPYSDSNVSPTPKRRKVGAYEESQKVIDRNVLNSQPDIRPNDDTENIEHSSSSIYYSPIHKMVAFSDKIDLSPPHSQNIASSPRSSDSKQPHKSILRNVTSLKAFNSDRTSDKNTSVMLTTQTLSQDSPNVQEYKPSQLEYWTNGEIHTLSNNNNINEFREILSGGLKILQEPVARRFEIYATFNNIIPIIDKPDIGSKNATAHINDDKILIVIANLQNIIPICLSHLEEEKISVINDSTVKNPFSIRLYIQIVKLFSILLSNFKIVKSLSNNIELQKKIKSVYKHSIEALASQFSNKAIIITHLTFLKDELFGKYYLDGEEIEAIVNVVMKIRETNSTNLMSEKLLLIKCFQSKYQNIMLKNVSIWLPGEVIPRIILDDGAFGWRIVISAISILLDLLKVYIDMTMYHNKLFNSIEVTSVHKVVPEKFLKPLLKTMSGRDNQDTTLGDIIRNHIRILVTNKKEYKISNDLWLAMVGLLYNNSKKIDQLFDQEESNSWIGVNKICFQTEDPSAKFLSLKVWRIVIYGVYIELSNKPFDASYNKKLLALLRRPFDMANAEIDNPTIKEAKMYLLNAITFISVALFSKRSTKYKLNKTIWNELLLPVYSMLLKNESSILLETRIIKLIFSIIGGDIEPVPSDEEIKEKKQWHNSPVIRVIASNGIPLSEIPAVKESSLNDIFPFVEDLLLKYLQGKNTNNFQIIIAKNLVQLTPTRYCNESQFNKYSNLAFNLFNKNDLTALDKQKYFYEFSISLISRFEDILFSSRLADMLATYLLRFKSIFDDNSETQIRLLKTLIKNVGDRQYEYLVLESFLKLKQEKTSIYITNWFGSMLLPKNISNTEFFILLRIVSMIPCKPVIANFVPLLVKFNTKLTVDQHNILDFLHMENWPPELVIYIVNLYARTNKNTLPKELQMIIQKFISRHPELFQSFLPLMNNSICGDMINNILDDNPKLVENITFLKLADIQKYFPENKRLYLLDNLSNFSVDVQIIIIKWIFNLDIVTDLRNYEAQIANFILNCDTLQTGIIIGNILSYCLENEWFDILSNLLDILLSKRNFIFIEDLLRDCDSARTIYLKPRTIVKIATEIEVLKQHMVVTINMFLTERNSSLRMTMINELIREENIDLLYSCKNHIYLFFLDFDNKLMESEKFTAIQIFKNFVNLVMLQSETSIYNFLYELTTLLPKQSNAYYRGYVHCFCSHLRLRDSSFKYNPELKLIYEALRHWEEGDNLSLYPDLFTSSKSTIIQSNIAKNSQKKKTEGDSQSSDIQISATQNLTYSHDQAVDISSSSVISDKSKNIITFSIPLNTARNRGYDNITTSLSKSKISGVEPNSLYELIHDSQEHLAKSTQLTQISKIDDAIKNDTENEILSTSVQDIENKVSTVPSFYTTNNLLANISHIVNKLTPTKFLGNRTVSESEEQTPDLNNILNDHQPNSFSPIMTQKFTDSSQSKTGNETLNKEREHTDTEEVNGPVGLSDGALDPLINCKLINIDGDALASGPAANQNDIIIIKQNMNTVTKEMRSRSPIIESESLVDNNQKRSAYSKINNQTQQISDYVDDDFLPVQINRDDNNFLKEMEIENDLSINHKPVSHNLKPIKEGKHDLESKYGNERNDQSTGLKIPIFNSLKMVSNGPSNQSINRKENYNKVAKEYKIPESVENQMFLNTLQDQKTLKTDDNQNFQLQSHLGVNDLSATLDQDSRESSPGLREHFPSRKARKLVTRIRSFSSDDFARLSPEERRNMRIEMLDLLMQLEYHTLNDK